MLTAHELFLALRPTPNGKERDLAIQPESSDVRVYLRQSSAWKWLDDWAHDYSKAPDADKRHPGFVLELHLDRLYRLDRTDPHGSERRYHFHERMMVEHGGLAELYRDGMAEPTGNPPARRRGFRACHEDAERAGRELTIAARGVINHASHSLQFMRGDDWGSLARYAEAMANRARELYGEGR
jgi:hypothetical protein